MIYIFTPETLKAEIDKLAKEKGFKFFLVGSDKVGNTYAPSKKNPNFRIPVAIPSAIFTDEKMNLSKALEGFYFIGFTDESVLSTESLKEYEKALQRERGNMRKLGRSQQAVYDYLKEHSLACSQQVGDALYEKCSKCFIEGHGGHKSGYWNTGKAKPEEVRRAWAGGMLTELKKKGLVKFTIGAGGVWWEAIK